MGSIRWRYLGEDAIEISDISSNIHIQLGLRDYLKGFPKLGIASFMFTDKTLMVLCPYRILLIEWQPTNIR
jgi:hypothetical protein